MNPKRGNVAATCLLVLVLMVGIGTASASANGETSGVDADGRSVVQLSGSSTTSHANSELVTIGILAAFAFVTAATALLTVRNQQDQ
jgi:hypothetical protein